MANSSISRTGTFTSSGSAGGSGTYHYNHGADWGSSGSSGYSGTDYYSNDDFKNGSIFTDIDDKLSITFSEEVDNTSVTVFNKDTELPTDLQNKKGAIGLTHIVSSTLGDTTDSNNLKALKLTSLPIKITGEEHEATANQEFVEMASIPSTEDNKTYVFTPKANLSSNTTYFLRMDPANILDSSGAGISYTTEKGFVTDNSQSFVTTQDYYDGFSIQIEKIDPVGREQEPPADGSDPQPTSLTLYRSGGTLSTATILNILSIEGTKLNYQLDPISYKMNVAYTATNPIVISSVNHELADNDKIHIYDVVSGNTVKKGTYQVTELTSDTFSVPIDGTGSSAGRLNYYRNANKNDLFKWRQYDSEIKHDDGTVWEWAVRKKAISAPKQSKISLKDDLLQAKITTIATSDGTRYGSGGVSGKIGKIIKINDSGIISFVAVDKSADGGKITSSAFVNNSIIEISTSKNDIRFHIKANTSPDHNVHPFHSSAPKVISTFPEDGESFPRKLTITQIARRGAIAIVSTNHPHNLVKDDFIKIIGSTQDIYNQTTKVLLVASSNTFQYDLDPENDADFTNVQSPAPGNPKLQISIDSGTTYAERYNAIFVNFSQSMNTSTVTVSDGANLVSANGTSAAYTDGQDSASSTIQLSDDGFETIENCVSVVASSGNSVFAIVPETLKARHAYNIKVKTDVQDLGQTNCIYQFATTEGITTGIKVKDPQTGEETTYSKDEDPPKIKKISIDTTVLESANLSEITSPDDYQAVATNLGGNPLTVQFSESMKINSVTTATSNTDSTGTVQLSCDDFNTVVQMTSTSPVVTTTDEDNDTFSFTPVANLSANAVYTLKVLKDVTDDSPEQNRMEQDNVSSIKTFSLYGNPADADDYYIPGEIISGIRTLTIKANTGTPTIGLTAGDTFLGLTSKGKGKVLDFTEDSGAIETIRYTELAGNDGSIRPLSPGEVCKVSDTINFTIDNVAITDPSRGNVVSFTSGTKRIVYRDNEKDNEFLTGTSSIERIVGRSSNGYAWTGSHGTSGMVGEGFKTTTTAIVANVHFRDSTGGATTSPVDSAISGVGIRSNVVFYFNQTMNVESINFNAVDSVVRDSYNILLSYDSSFGNTIPLSTNFTSSNNDTAFEFQPAILSNTNLQLTQDKNLYAKVVRTDASITDNLKNKGDMNIVSSFAPSNEANTVTNLDFQAIEASVFTTEGEEIKLGRGTSVDMPNQSSIIARSTLVIIHFNEVANVATFALGSGDEIELSTSSTFASGHYSGTGTLTKQGKYGTEIQIRLSVGLTASTQYYLRVVGSVGGTNEGGKAIDTTTQYFNSFTTSS